MSISDDLFVGVWNPSRTRFEATTPVCVWDENGGAYRVQATGLASGDDFALADSAGFTIDYRLRWLRSGTNGQREQLRQGQTSRRLYNFSTTEGCLDDEPPHLDVRINTRDLDRAPPGIYRDTVMLLIEPI